MTKSTKKLSLAIVFVAVVSILMMLVAVADYTGTDANITWTLDTSDGHLTIQGSGAMPTYEKGNAPWYQYKSNVKSIEVKSGITVSLGAFYGMENTAEIILPEVYGGYIGYVFGAGNYFQNNTYLPGNLKTVTISASSTIQQYAFNGAQVIGKVVLADSITTVSDYAFKDCSGLSKIVFGSGVKTIGANAFQRCTSLDNAFFNGTSTGWSGVSVDKTNTIAPICLADGALTVTAPAKLTYELNESLDLTGFGAAFAGNNCTNAVEIIAPDMTTVGAKTVTVLYGTKSASFVVNVVGTAKSGVSGIATWSVSGGLLTISGNGMMDNYTLETLAPWYIFRDSITSVVVNDGITSVGAFAFYGLDKATSITLGASVEAVEYAAFADCPALTAVTVSNTDAVVDGTAFNGCIALYQNSGNAVYAAVSGNANYALISVDPALTSFTIPSNTAVIAQGAFENSAITSITIPDSVKAIGDNAFASSALTDITIGSGVKVVGNYAFVDSASFVNVTFNATPDFIGAGAFSATSVTGTTVSNAVYLAAGSNPYAILLEAANEDITSCTPLAQTEIIASLAFSNCSALESVQLSEGVRHIGDSAFNGCTSLFSIQFPSTLETIGDSAFKNCAELVSVNLNNVKVIGNGAFRGAAALAEIVIGNNTENVGFNAFRDCSALTKVIYNAKSGIGYKTFAGCSALSDIYLADSVLSIGEYAFMNTAKLSTIAIPDTTGVIGYGALYGSAAANISLPFVGEKANGAYTSLDYIYGGTVPASLGTVLVGADLAADAFNGVDSIDTLIIDKTTNAIAANAISITPSTVYYMGSESEWASVNKGSNTGLANTEFANSTFGLISNKTNYPVGSIIDRADFVATLGSTDVTNILRFENNPVVSNEIYLNSKLGSTVQKFASKYVSPIEFTNYSLLLEGSIGVKFYVRLSDAVIENFDTLTATFDYYGETYTADLVKADNTVDGTIYTAKFYVAAKEMNRPITFTVSIPEHTASITRTVKDYVDYVNENADSYADCITLINEMYNYGEYSRHYFEDVAISPNPDLSGVDLTIANGYTPTKSGSVTGISLSGTSLLLESNTTVRHYFALEAGADINDYTFKVNGRTVTPQVRDSLYYIEVTNIIAKDLGKIDKTVITRGDETLTISYSPLSYVKLALENRAEADPDLADLSKALYNYYVAAKDYFATFIDQLVLDANESAPSIW